MAPEIPTSFLTLRAGKFGRRTGATSSRTSRTTLISGEKPVEGRFRSKSQIRRARHRPLSAFGL